MQCRPSCGACCVALSISSAIPGMPNGKPAGLRCLHLSDDQRCLIFALPSRPKVCAQLKPGPDICGTSREQAYDLIAALELNTTPSQLLC